MNQKRLEKLQNKQQVTAPKGCASYLTPGKTYDVSDVTAEINGITFKLIADQGSELICLLDDDAHLNKQDWIV